MSTKMKSKRTLGILVVALSLLFCSVNLSQAIPMGTAFTYQGFLDDGGNPADGLYDIEFRVYDDPAAGIQQGSTVMMDDEDIIDGSFTVELDFGAGIFAGEARWLEIGLRPGASTGVFTLLLPRQELTLTPYALYAASSGGFPVPLLLSGSSIGPIIEGINTGSGVGIHGHASSTNGDGIYGTTAGGSGRAVVGVATTGGDVQNYGGYFTAGGETARGVYGYASNGGNGKNYGGYFEAAGKYGRGVYAEGTGESARGVWGETSGQYAIGVEGVASGDNSYGVYGFTSGTVGRGVVGLANNTGNVENYGGHFTAKGVSGRGVYGSATGAQGLGVFGEATGSYGAGVLGISTGLTGKGVTGRAITDDPATTQNWGGFFEADAEFGQGVYGYATGLSGRGVYGYAPGSSATGVRGYGGKNDFYATGPGTDYASSSSIRWKSEIRPIDDSLNKVMSLRGVYFNWDADHGGHCDVGMIAEEVGEVLPEIVDYEANGTDATSMDYSKLTPLLVEAVKTLNTQLCELQERQGRKDDIIEMLSDQNRLLTQRLAAIESIIDQAAQGGKELSNEVF